MFKRLTFITISHILAFLLLTQAIILSLGPLIEQVVSLTNLLIDGFWGMVLGVVIMILSWVLLFGYYLKNYGDWVKRFEYYFIKILIHSPCFLIAGFFTTAVLNFFMDSYYNFENLLGFSICFHCFALGEEYDFGKPWSIDYYHNKIWFKVFFGLIIMVLLLLPFFNLNLFDQFNFMNMNELNHFFNYMLVWD